MLAIPATQATTNGIAIQHQQQTLATTSITADGKQITLPFTADVHITHTDAGNQNGIPHAVKEETVENGTQDNTIATYVETPNFIIYVIL